MIIYDKNGNTRCTVKAFEYHDVFMGECYLSIDIDSPEPISFAVGDYCIFRGEYFYLNYVPSAEKTASKDSRGDAFKYSAMKLDSSLDELTRCLFLDIVPSSYNVTFTGLPDFTFYAQTAQNLADRIQANLDSLYGTGVWTINVITSNLVDYNQVLCSVSGNKPIDASMSISGKTCMEALAEFYNTFKLTYIVRGRTITVAPTGTAVGATFGYGKGNGLSGLKQQTKADSLLITRLYCYGSTRNIGTKYYANLTGKAYSSIKTDTVKYETVVFQFSGTATNTDIITIILGGTAFHVDMSSYTGTGPIQGTSFADYIASKTFSGWTSSHATGTNIVTFTANDSGIKPDSSFGANPNTMTAEITVAQKGLSPYQQVTSVTPNYFYILLVISKNSSYYKEKVTYNGESVYKVKLKCGNYEVGGYISLNVTEATVAKVYPTETNYSNFISQVNNSSTIYITDGVWLDLMSSEFVEYDNIFSANLAVTHLMLPDFPFVKSNPNDVFIDSNNKNTLGIRQGQVYFDGSDSSHPEVYPTIHEMTAKEVIDSGISLSLDSAEGTDMSKIRLDEIKDCDNPTDNGYISTTTDNTQNPTTFTIYLKDVGFDLTFLSGSELYYASGGKLTISMLSGSCSGREFTVNGARIEKDYTKGYLRYKIVCDRYQDHALNKQFPYSDYKINAGDTFVLLNCRLPNVYVAAASQKLLNYGNAFLAKNDSTKYTYIPQLDEIWMANHPDIANSIKTGDLFDFSDTDLNISEKVFIKTLNIKVGDKLIPTYDLTLDDTIESSTIQKIQNQIDNISVGSYTQTNIINNLDVIKSTDVSPILSDTNIPSSLYVDDNYISSKEDDSAEGHITFNKGMTAEGVSTIDEADVHALKADSAEIYETNTKDLTAENEAILKNGFKTDDFVTGVSGAQIDDKGNSELNSLSIRSYLKVMELIYNRRTAMEGDFAFSEFGTIDSITEVTAGTYNLHFRKRYDNDFIAFHENDILMGVVDPKVNGTGMVLYTSYVRVLSVNTTDNTAQVVVYNGSEVPSGTNYPPVTSMNMIRIGNSDSPVDGSVNTRQDFWKLSTDEGRIVFLQNVYKPILESFNYALSIGKLPDLDIFKNLPIGKDDMSIYSKNVVAQNYYKIDANGIVQTNEVYRGLWSEQVASSKAPYRRIVKEVTSGTGTVVNVLELHTVYHLGCKWACLVDKTTEEPRWNSTGWQMIQGDSNYSINFSSTNGWQFFYGKVDTTISARIFYGNEDITERTLPLAGVSIEWVRNTDNVPEDNAWIPTFGDNKLNLKLTTGDMGSNWMTKRTATFTCNIYIPVGEDTQLITNNISFNL